MLYQSKRNKPNQEDFSLVKQAAQQIIRFYFSTGGGEWFILPPFHKMWEKHQNNFWSVWIHQAQSKEEYEKGPICWMGTKAPLSPNSQPDSLMESSQAGCDYHSTLPSCESWQLVFQRHKTVEAEHSHHAKQPLMILSFITDVRRSFWLAFVTTNTVCIPLQVTFCQTSRYLSRCLLLNVNCICYVTIYITYVACICHNLKETSQQCKKNMFVDLKKQQPSNKYRLHSLQFWEVGMWERPLLLILRVQAG